MWPGLVRSGQVDLEMLQMFFAGQRLTPDLRVWESRVVWGQLGSIILLTKTFLDHFSTKLCVGLSWAIKMKHGCCWDTHRLVGSCGWASALCGYGPPAPDHPWESCGPGLLQLSQSMGLKGFSNHLPQWFSQQIPTVQVSEPSGPALALWWGVSELTKYVQEERNLEETI